MSRTTEEKARAAVVLNADGYQDSGSLAAPHDLLSQGEAKPFTAAQTVSQHRPHSVSPQTGSLRFP